MHTKVDSTPTFFDAKSSAKTGSLNSPTSEEKLNNLINEISQKLDENSKVCNTILAKFVNKTDLKEASLILTPTD